MFIFNPGAYLPQSKLPELIRIKQYGEYEGNLLKAPDQLVIPFAAAATGFELFLLECDSEHEPSVTIAGSAESYSLESDSQGVWRVRHTGAKVPDIDPSGRLLLDVVWTPKDRTRPIRRLRVELRVTFEVDASALKKLEYHPPNIPVAFSLIDANKTWRPAGEIAFDWSAVIKHLRGHLSELTVELAVRPVSSAAPPPQLRISTANGAIASTPMALSELLAATSAAPASLELLVDRDAAPRATGLAVAIDAIITGASHSFVAAEIRAEIPVTVKESAAEATFRISSSPESEPVDIVVDTASIARKEIKIDLQIDRHAKRDNPFRLLEIAWAYGIGESGDLILHAEGVLGFGAPASPQRTIALQDAYGNVELIAPPNWNGACVLQLRRSNGAGGQTLCDIRPTFHEVRKPNPRRLFAIDLGASSICMAYMSDADRAVRFVPVGRTLANFDEAHNEIDETVGFDAAHDCVISSTIGIHLTGRNRRMSPPWRDDAYPSTRWGDLANPAKRRLRASVPYAPSSHVRRNTGPGAFIAPSMKMQALSRREHLSLTRIGDIKGTPPKVRLADAYREVFEELGAFHLPWAGVGDAVSGGCLILTHPHQFYTEDEERLKEAASPLRTALGITEDNVILVPEGRAALQHIVASHGQDIDKVRTKISADRLNLLVLDIGAGTLDATMAEIDYSNGAFAQIRETGYAGASMGGDTIDLVLYFMVHDKLLSLHEQRAINYTTRLVAEPGRRRKANVVEMSARRNLRDEIGEAKRRLSKTLARRAGIGWPDDVLLEVSIREAGLDSGLVRDPAPDHPDLRTVRTTDGSGQATEYTRLIFRKSELLNNAMMRALLRFTCETVPQVLTHGASQSGPIHLIALTGRASLWPLVPETLMTACNPACDGSLAKAKFLNQLTDVRQSELKAAVVEGALNYALNQGRPSSSDNHPADAAKTRQRQPVGALEQNRDYWRFRQLRSDAPLRNPTGNQVTAVTHPIGLDDFESQGLDWRLSLLRSTDQIPPRDSEAQTDDHLGAIRTETGEYAQFTLKPIGRPTNSISASGAIMHENDRPPQDSSAP